MLNYVVIDAFNFILIAASAALKNLDNPDLSYHITSTMIQKLKGLYNGAEFYACWDEYGGTQFRKEIDPSYKEGRSTLAVVSVEEVKEFKNLFEMYGVTNVSIESTEADDTIYCLCKVLKEKHPSSNITIISRDKDLVQVVQSGYANQIYDYTKKKYVEIPWYDIVLYKSLVGDTSDKLLGVRGIGPKTAVKILSEYLNEGKLNLTEEQKEQFDRCRKIVDASLHPRLQENLTKLRNEIV